MQGSAKRRRLLGKQAPSANAEDAKVAEGLPTTVVVNLARRPDRWKDIQRSLSTLEGGPLKFERLEAVDGSSGVPLDLVARTWLTTRNWRYVVRVFEGGKKCGYMQKELDLTPGERGCAASHIVAWKRCAQASGPLMILEDDASPQKGFIDTLRKALADLQAESPDILYLGYTQASPWRRKVSSLLREAEYLWTTVAYVLWPSGAQKLLAKLPVDQPVDNFMAGLMASRQLRGFAVFPCIVEQAKAWNVDNDVSHSDDAAWIQNCK